MPTFKRIRTGQSLLDRIQDSVAEALAALDRWPIKAGRVIEDVSLITGQANLVKHKLNRRAKYIVVRKNADARVWDVKTNIESQALDLRCSANVTVDLVVF